MTSGRAAPAAKEAADASAACERARAQDLGNAQFIAGMRAERVLRHQLRRDFGGELRVEAAFDVDRSEFPVLGVDVGLEFPALAREIRMFRVGLRTDGDVFAGRHGHRAGDEPGEPGDQHGAAVGAGGRDADYEAGSRDDPVVRAEDRRAKPVDATRAMSFPVTHLTSG